jgi:hypothetical protein
MTSKKPTPAKKKAEPTKKVVAAKKSTTAKKVAKETTKKIITKKVVKKEEVEAIRYKLIGNNFNVIIGGKVNTKTFSKEQVKEKEELKESINKFNKLANKESLMAKKLYDKIVSIVTKKKDIEKEVEKIKTEKKVVKNKIKIEKQKKEVKEVIYKKYLPKDVFKVDKKAVSLIDFNVTMPELLVDKIVDTIKKKQDYKPFVRFWELCLLNPNVTARTKLFDYLELHNLMVTENGYFVTYRMVKTTNKIGVFTHAHNGIPRMEYKIGQVSRLDRATECDEDGGKDCSRGLHTGSPLFIGIKTEAKKIDLTAGETVGDGYGIGVRIVTKEEHSGSYGTGYDRPTTRKVEEKFDESFGNQAVICLVNPMHVVSVPNSDTRKLRACELYFAATTTPEEVVEHLTSDSNIYSGYDKAYKSIEESEIKEKLKEANLTDTFKSKVNPSKAKLEELKKKLDSLKIGKDTINKELNPLEVKKLIQNRIVKLK